MAICVLVALAVLLVGCAFTPSPVTRGESCKEANLGTEPAYLDPRVCVEERVENLLARMTPAEKVGQMTLVEKNSIEPEDITARSIGALLSGGGGYPTPNTPAAWAQMVDGFQEHALQTRLGIPLLYGVDAVHGHGNVKGAVIFPHNIGLGATRDADLVKRIGAVTAREMMATGIPWNYAPVVAVPQDIRWGRTYEGYSEDTELVAALGTAYLQGLQNIDGERALDHRETVMGTPKHFVADGATTWGSSTTGDYQIDQGVADIDEASLRAVHLPPYERAIDAGALSIMVSFSSWGGLKMHAQRYLLTDVLKDELGFEGFLVSDWEAINQIPGDYYQDVVTSINAGIDMVMVPSNYDLFILALTAAVENGDVPQERVDDAVRRILRAKFHLGLFEHPFANTELLPAVGSQDHRTVAREAVRKSLVLLKNRDDTLPLSKDNSLLFVAGTGANDIGIQSGGWTIEWQGRAGRITAGTTILEGIKETVDPQTRVHYNRWGKFDRITDDDGNPAVADVGIVVVGEMPYAEGVGDRADLTLTEQDVALIERVNARSRKVVVVLISGRPLIVTETLEDWDALVAAWLPGTEGQGIADVLFGDYPFSGKLPYTWPRSMRGVPQTSIPDEGSECQAVLFPFGYGLTTDEEAEVPDCP